MGIHLVVMGWVLVAEWAIILWSWGGCWWQSGQSSCGHGVGAGGRVGNHLVMGWVLVAEWVFILWSWGGCWWQSGQSSCHGVGASGRVGNHLVMGWVLVAEWAIKGD